MLWFPFQKAGDGESAGSRRINSQGGYQCSQRIFGFGVLLISHGKSRRGLAEEGCIEGQKEVRSMNSLSLAQQLALARVS